MPSNLYHPIHLSRWLRITLSAQRGNSFNESKHFTVHWVTPPSYNTFLSGWPTGWPGDDRRFDSAALNHRCVIIVAAQVASLRALMKLSNQPFEWITVCSWDIACVVMVWSALVYVPPYTHRKEMLQKMSHSSRSINWRSFRQTWQKQPPCKFTSIPCGFPC